MVSSVIEKHGVAYRADYVLFLFQEGIMETGGEYML